MKFLNNWRYRTLYILWAVLFVLTAVLGLLFPAAEGIGRGALMVLAAIFFVPPWMILLKARQEGNDHHRKLILLLSVLALAAAMALMCAVILSANLSAGVRQMVHILTTVVTAPMVCSNYYVLPLFLWASLFVTSLKRAR